MRHGVAGARVDGVGVFPAVLDVELAIVAGSDDAAGAPVRLPDALDVRAGRVVAVHGVVHPDRPAPAGGVDAVAEDLPDVHKHILHADGVEVGGHHIAGVSLGYCVEIQYFLFLAGGQGGRDALRVGQAVRGEAEAPDVEQRRRGHVERTVRLRLVALRQGADFGEETVRNDLLPGIVAAQQGRFVVAGQAEVDADQQRVDRRPDFFRRDAHPREVRLDAVGAALGVS